MASNTVFVSVIIAWSPYACLESQALSALSWRVAGNWFPCPTWPVRSVWFGGREKPERQDRIDSDSYHRPCLACFFKSQGIA